MKESDWKIFKQISAQALEKFCAKSLTCVSQSVKDKQKSHHERFTDIYLKMRKADKDLAKIFDGLSRGTASIQLTLIRRLELDNKELTS